MEEQPIIDRLKWIGIAMLVVFPLLFLGGFHVVGPFSARMIVAYGLLVYAMRRGSTDYMPTRGIKMYYVYMIAAANKFLRIYYARVRDALKEQ